MIVYLRLAFQCDVRRRAAIIACIVGPIIAVINHGDSIAGGTITNLQWLKIAMTFIVPYSVSTVSSVLAIKEHDGC